MSVTLRTLIGARELRIGAIGRDGHPSPDPASAIPDTEITWVHSSDLLDPTPWLDSGQVLLTNGGQFDPADLDPESPVVADYVDRLTGTGIVALGFAADVVHEGVPESLVEACRRGGLPLLRIEADLPFIRIIRHVADVLDRERTERIAWSVRAQRAVARATLRPDGLSATLRELERQLGCWVALVDPLGRLVPVRSRYRPPAAALDEICTEAEGLLRAGRRSATHRVIEGAEVTLQTIGQGGRLRGVLAVGSNLPLDPAGTDLLASVIGIASIAIEQSRALDQARRELRTGIMALFEAEATDAARRALRELGSWDADGDIRVVVVAGVTSWATLLDELELRAVDDPFAFARVGEELVLVVPADADASLYGFVERYGLRAGASAPLRAEDFPAGRSQARGALRRASSDGRIVRFDRLAEEGVFAWLAGADGYLPAQRLLAPVRERADAETLIASARAWFAHNCSWDPAARALGIHRHTLHSRIAALGSVCGVDLDGFEGRAELWAALELA